MRKSASLNGATSPTTRSGGIVPISEELAKQMKEMPMYELAKILIEILGAKKAKGLATYIRLAFLGD